MMAGAAPPGPRAGRHPSRWLAYVIILGLYLSLRGYHSFDGDQAYRLPLLLHQQDASVFAGDPFVEAFTAFNPHRGSLWLLDMITRPVGLPAGLFVAFALTFAVTCAGIDRLARAVWPQSGWWTGILAVILVLAAKAGNIGTNHLFEAIFLDRLMALALGWLALAEMVIHPDRAPWRAAALIGLAAIVHPSAGLQLAMVLAATRVLWSLLDRWTFVSARMGLLYFVALAVAVAPGLALNLAANSPLTGDISDEVFWLLSVELQGPQHMLPHSWRMPQWLAWSCYLALAAISLGGLRPDSARGNDEPGIDHRETGSGDLDFPKRRLTALMAVILGGLAGAWYLIEVRQHLRVTVFQPFRMATAVRGIALVMLAGRLIDLWRRGDGLSRMRAILLPVALTGDWLLVVATVAELAVSAVESIRVRIPLSRSWRTFDAVAWFGMLGAGWYFLGHHDTEYGHIPLLATVGLGLVVAIFGVAKKHNCFATARPEWTPRRLRAAAVAAWIVPAAALVVAILPHESNRAGPAHGVVWGLVNRCRFLQVPLDDIEHLALWCRGHTPRNARFVGPPGPKTFRLWSQRSVAFNRAASPYHGAGLADWFTRFQDHVGFHGSPADFVRAYVTQRHEFESRYQVQSDAAKAALAARQGAEYVIAAAPPHQKLNSSGSDVAAASMPVSASAGPLELLHVEGRYAVYRVQPAALVQRQR